MNIDQLLTGLISLALGLIGLIWKSNMNNSETSYTMTKMRLGIYLLIGAGSGMIILSLFSE